MSVKDMPAPKTCALGEVAKLRINFISVSVVALDDNENILNEDCMAVNLKEPDIEALPGLQAELEKLGIDALNSLE